MANQLAGGDINNLQPGLDYFKKLKEAGNLTTVDVTNGTIDSGQTGVSSTGPTTRPPTRRSSRTRA